MSKSLNQCNFIGNLGGDPDTRVMPNGNTVCNFSIAVSDDYTKDGQKVQHTEWIRIVAFNKIGEVCGQYLKKGSKVFITGKFKTRQWEKDGAKHYATEITVSEIQFLDSRNSQGAAPGDQQQSQAQSQGTANNQQQSPPSDFDDFSGDIPF